MPVTYHITVFIVGTCAKKKSSKKNVVTKFVVNEFQTGHLLE